MHHQHGRQRRRGRRLSPQQIQQCAVGAHAVHHERASKLSGQSQLRPKGDKLRVPRAVEPRTVEPCLAHDSARLTQQRCAQTLWPPFRLRIDVPWMHTHRDARRSGHLCYRGRGLESCRVSRRLQHSGPFGLSDAHQAHARRRRAC